MRVLEFKCNYLLGNRKTRSLVEDLQQMVSQEPFLPHHRITALEFKTVVDFKEQNKNKLELKNEGSEYDKLAKR